MSAALDSCAALVRRVDPDRYFAGLFAPAAQRPFLYALFALNHELARVSESVREPMLGHIRLQWWRESLEEARAGNARRHDVVEGMSQAFARHDVPPNELEAMISARALDLSDEGVARFEDLYDYLDATSGNLMRIAARILGRDVDEDTLAREAGIAYGLAGVIRGLAFQIPRGKIFLPRDALEAAGTSSQALLTGEGGEGLRRAIRDVVERSFAFYRRAQSEPKPGTAIAAFLPAALVPLYLKRIERSDDAVERAEPPLFRRQLRLLIAAASGRI